MIRKAFAMSGHLEMLVRSFLYNHPDLKEGIKNRWKRSSSTEKKEFDEKEWDKYTQIVSDVVKEDEIVLVHSSIDGLNSIGASAENVLSLLLSLQQKGCTVVLPAYAIGSSKVVNGRLKKYNPKKSPCWTGLLPNLFLQIPGVVRTVFPYNSLAAIGPHAEKMMADNNKQVYTYGDYSAWKYCVDNHAKILFIGVTSDDSNTIQSHMIADVMKNDWPIDNWYQSVVCPIQLDDEIIEKRIMIQKDEWVKYIADFHITKKLVKKGILHEQIISNCYFGYVEDSKVMVDYLVHLAKNGDLSYIVPRKYRKR